MCQTLGAKVPDEYKTVTFVLPDKSITCQRGEEEQIMEDLPHILSPIQKIRIRSNELVGCYWAALEPTVISGYLSGHSYMRIGLETNLITITKKGQIKPEESIKWRLCFLTFIKKIAETVHHQCLLDVENASCGVVFDLE